MMWPSVSGFDSAPALIVDASSAVQAATTRQLERAIGAPLDAPCEPSLHRFLHSDGGETNHQCLVCSFAKGQVTAAEVSGVFAALVISLVGLILLPKVSPLPSFDFRLSPSRAPPRR